MNEPTYHDTVKRMRQYMRGRPGLRQKIEDCWRPHQISRIKLLLNGKSSLEEFWTGSRANRREMSLLDQELIVMLQGAPIEDLPQDAYELDMVLTLVNGERSVRSCKRILGQIQNEAESNPKILDTSQIFEDMQRIDHKLGLGLNYPPLPRGNP